MESFYQHYIEQLAHNRRSLRVIEKNVGNESFIAGQRLLNFCSNDYLGLSRHPLLQERANQFATEWGSGATAGRLICGNFEIFEQVEAKIASLKKTESALLFNSGFQANASALAALLNKDVLQGEPLVFSDRLNHASMHEGCRLAEVKQIRYRHLDLVHLETLLKKYVESDRPKFILTESVFSMDGDCVDLGALLALKKKYNAYLYLDEAHSAGVMGANGMGLSSDYPGQVDVVLGTFGKALGSAGAYIACSNIVRDYLINTSRGFIYSTGLPPMVLGAMDAALDLVPEMDAERAHLQKISAQFRAGIQALGGDVGSSTTQIIPLILGDAERAIAVSNELEAAGVLALAIRPPTVPKGEARVRFSLNALHIEAEIEAVLSILGKCTVTH
ncbi:MAG: 8-amino-7-oxononanoate synthase [Alphaproteobacteria bacterium]